LLKDQSSIYIHIPFCKQACHYCNFHFSTSLRSKDLMVAAIIKEIELRKDFLASKTLSSVYFGGGTPSLLDVSDLELIFNTINQHFTLTADAEITLEANPDDLTLEKLLALKNTPINRLSIGIQSFVETDLKYMNRAHNAAEAIQSIKNAQHIGFQNITLDLIYGTPTLSDEDWAQNLATTFEFGIPHISCYALTVEEKTVLHKLVKTGKLQPVDDEKAARHFEYLMEAMAKNGYEHYEISNFAKPDHYAKHNTGYWFGRHYLGIGPSAHSYDGATRSWNIANNALYMKQINDGNYAPEVELLSENDRYNELVMTALRTQWGLDLNLIQNPIFRTHFLENVQQFIDNQMIVFDKITYKITTKGRFMSDGIASALFI
jgi:oxygen-independent coproporphyrinogen III oxidase